MGIDFTGGSLFMVLLLFAAGLLCIIKGGDLFVDAAGWIAEASGIPKFIIGATIVSVATTLPEIIVSTIAAVDGLVPDQVIRTFAREFGGVEHRIEFVRELDGVRYINDSKGTNVDSTIKAIQTMTRPTAIILGGYDKHCDFTPMVQEMLASPYIKEAQRRHRPVPQAFFRRVECAAVPGMRVV